MLDLSGDELTGNLSARGAILNTTPAGSSTPTSLDISASTLTGNAAVNGGAIASTPGAGATGAISLTITNSTIAGNSAQTVGGGIWFGSHTAGSSATITNSTITANTAQQGGGGIYASGPVTLTNTIIAANKVRTGTDADCQAAATEITDGPGGHNLIGNPTGCPQLQDNTNGDQTGAIHPGLLTLANNGGPTDTVALQLGSLALGAGDPGTCATAGDRDQRGSARHTAKRGCDAGAYDTGGTGGTVDRTYVVAPGGSDAVSCAANTSSSPFATIQKALGCTVDGDIINLAPTGTQPYPGIGAVNSNVIIQAQHGANARTVLIDAGKGELSIAPGINVTLAGVNLSCPANDCIATPTITNEGTLTLSGNQLTGNLSVHSAILNTTTPGSFTPASLRISNSTLAGNAGLNGGAIANTAGAGATGAISLAIANSTIAGNTALTAGGGIWFAGTTPGSSATIINTTITTNTAHSGGGIYATGPATLANTIIATNTIHGGNGPDCYVSETTITDGPGGHNLIGNPTGCPQLQDNTNGDQTGTAGSPLDPLLGALAVNGGTTETESPLANSPAIASGLAEVCESGPIEDKDQRGKSRKGSARRVCDVGAYDTGGKAVRH